MSAALESPFSFQLTTAHTTYLSAKIPISLNERKAEDKKGDGMFGYRPQRGKDAGAPMQNTQVIYIGMKPADLKRNGGRRKAISTGPRTRSK
jgi:hypothetical protein